MVPGSWFLVTKNCIRLRRIAGFSRILETSIYPPMGRFGEYIYFITDPSCEMQRNFKIQVFNLGK
jgi:hypothetical protein